MAYIKCPKCQNESYFSLSSFKGPYRCMKCKETFSITIQDGQVTYSEMSQDEIDAVRRHDTRSRG